MAREILSGALEQDLLGPDSPRWEHLIEATLQLERGSVRLLAPSDASDELARRAVISGRVLAVCDGVVHRVVGDRTPGCWTRMLWPVRAHGRVYALLELHQPPGRPCASRDLHQLSRLTFHLGRGYAQATRLAEAADDNDQLAALHEITVSIGRGDTGGLESTLQLVAHHAQQLLSAASGRLELLSEDREQRTITAVAGAPWGTVGHVRPALEGLGGWTLRHRQPAVLHSRSEWRTDPQLPGLRGVVRRSETHESVVTVPLSTGTEPPFGLLSVCHERPDRFGARQVELLVRLAAQASVAIEHARLLSTTAAAYEQARGEAARLAALTATVQDCLVVLGPTGSVDFHSPSFAALTGHDAQSCQDVLLSDLCHPLDLGLLEELLERCREQGRYGPVEFRLRSSGGAWIWFEVMAGSFRDQRRGGQAIVLSLRETAHRRELESQLRHLAYHDELTGLANRTALIESVRARLSDFESWTDIVVLFLDLDLFKTVNDTLGHAVGDELLAAIGRRLEEIVRPVDLVARLGGDEFAILLTDTDEQGAKAVVDRLFSLLEVPFTVRSEQLNVSASVGVAMARPGEDLDEVLSRADLAMYEAKAAGRNRYAFFTPSMRAAEIEKRSIEHGLRQALANGELVVRYQPIVALDSGELTGFEALLRWAAPGAPERAPAEFLQVAETTGLMAPIGAFVLDEACRQLGRWRDDFEIATRLQLGVNLSASEVVEPGLAERVRSALRRAELPPSALILELTETVLLEHNSDSLRERLAELTTSGVALALDDFGTGYSSLSHLRDFPVSVLKIDRSFVAGVADLERSGSIKAALTRGLVQLAVGLGLVVIAEGLESAEDIGCLSDWGVLLGQGYALGRPMLAGEVERHCFAVAHRPGSLRRRHVVA